MVAAAEAGEGPAPLSGRQRTDKKHSSSEIHAGALNDIERLLPAGSLERTFKGCKADFGYRVGAADALLPIQVRVAKAARERTNSYRFNSSNGGSSEGVHVLLLCHPYPSQQQTLVLPQSMVPQGGVTMTLNPQRSLKYHGYLISDDLLAEVLEGICDGVRARHNSFTMPSDEIIDISQLELKAIGELSVPTSLTNRTAWEYFLLRKQWLPEIDFQTCKRVPSPVSVLVERVRLIDRVARYENNPYGSIGMKCHLNRSYHRPIEKGDFDALWAYHPDKVHFWLIPAHELVERGFLATHIEPGKWTLHLYDQSYVKPYGWHLGEPADLWSQGYLYSSQDPGLSAKIREALEALKP